MDKKEFLDILSQTLMSEVSADVIDKNIKYYDQYIGSQSMEEEAKIIEMLGDPRLIAKTIIETEKIAKQKGRYQNRSDNGSNTDSDNNATYTDRDDELGQKQNRQGGTILNMNFTWYQKLIAILILIAVIIVVVLIGRIIIGFLFAFAVPILLVLLLFALFKKRN